MASTTAAKAAATKKLDTPIKLCTCAASIRTLLPPIAVETTASPNIGMKVKTNPATIPGRANGNIICTKVLKRLAPKSPLASR